MNKYFYFNNLLFAFLFSITGNAQMLSNSASPTINRFTKVDALEGLKVKCMLQDKHDFIWLGTDMGLHRFDGYSKQLITGTTAKGMFLPDNAITSLFEDPDTNLWIGTENGIYCINSNRTSIRQYLVEKNYYLNGKNTITGILEDKSGRIWCGSENGQVYNFTKGKGFESIPNLLSQYTDGLFSPILKISLDKNGYIWIATFYRGVYKINTEGIIVDHYPVANINSFVLEENSETPVLVLNKEVHIYDVGKNLFVPFLSGPKDNYMPIEGRCLLKDEQYIWLNYNYKLYRWEIASRKIEDYSLVYLGFEQIDVHNLYKDRYQNLWLSTGSGLFKMSSHLNYFSVITPPRFTKDSYFSTRGMIEEKGKLFIGSYQGFFEYHPDQQTFKEHLYWNEQDKQWIKPVVRAVIKDTAENFWIGSEGMGLLRFNTKTQIFTPVEVNNGYKNTNNPEIGSANYICSLIKDKKNNLWLGAYNGLFILKKPYGKQMPQVSGMSHANLHTLNVRALHQSADESVWVGTDGGLFRITDKAGITAHYTSGISSGKALLSNDFINCLYEDTKGNIWIGTKGGGINVLNSKKGVVEKVYTVQDGLAHNIVYAILPGAADELWISTHNGLSRFNRNSKRFRNFYVRDGLPHNEFNQGSAMIGKDGKLYFGGLRGIVSFSPQDIHKEEYTPIVKLTKMLKHNGVNNKIEETSLSIHTLKRIDLGYKDKFFTLHFALANRYETSKSQFSYKISGISDEWQYIGANNYIQFAGLPAGRYVLHVKGADSNGIWASTDLTIPIYVEQAYYATIWAYIIYVLIVITIAFAVVRFQWKRIQLQNQLKLEHIHSQKLQEIDRTKSQFFTNIVHEFRTPLTLILGPAEKMLSESTDAKYKRWAGTVQRNSMQMLGLINQLLDLSKLELRMEKLEPAYLDIISFVQDTTYAIQSLADEKNIHLTFQSDSSALMMHFDAGKVQKILYNLLSNACKFTPTAGKILVSVHQATSNERDVTKKYVCITVTDTGIGIAKEHLPLIFNRYFQVPDAYNRRFAGTGIGLSLVKELTELHGGTISLLSEPAVGTTFTVSLPIITPALPVGVKVKDSALEDFSKIIRYTKKEPIEESEDNLKETDQEKQVILIIEDHGGIRSFMKESLASFYRVIEASNGIEGLKAAKEYIPDIIISDVMMPQMDGHTFIHLIKQDELTSHIPVILLTARSSLHSRIEGLKTGADLYLTKPFGVEEFLLSIKNLLNLRQKIQKRLLAQALPVNSQTLCYQGDQSFLERFTNIVDKHLSDDNFGVEEMATQIGMSRTQLHRKVKAVTGDSTSHLIRTIRLQRAVKMLKNNSLSVTDIAYQVGFSSPSYFTESFTKHFGHPPNEGRKIKV